MKKLKSVLTNIAKGVLAAFPAGCASKEDELYQEAQKSFNERHKKAEEDEKKKKKKKPKRKSVVDALRESRKRIEGD